MESAVKPVQGMRAGRGRWPAETKLYIALGIRAPAEFYAERNVKNSKLTARLWYGRVRAALRM